ncbi:hypothetical protein M2271_006588 [Streptomyces sp. LBL]|nr:hypothetical protein [Streptomyces sp. LBL]
MPSEASTTASPLLLLPLPALDGLSQEQVRGAACIWCGVRLVTTTAVDLGERRHRRLDGVYSTFPRACRGCAGEAAVRALRDHAGQCEQCVDDASLCEIRTALEPIAREGR